MSNLREDQDYYCDCCGRHINTLEDFESYENDGLCLECFEAEVSENE